MTHENSICIYFYFKKYCWISCILFGKKYQFSNLAILNIFLFHSLDYHEFYQQSSEKLMGRFLLVEAKVFILIAALWEASLTELHKS